MTVVRKNTLTRSGKVGLVAAGLVVFLVYASISTAIGNHMKSNSLIEQYKEEISKLEGRLQQYERREEGRQLLEQRSSSLVAETIAKAEEDRRLWEQRSQESVAKSEQNTLVVEQRYQKENELLQQQHSALEKKLHQKLDMLKQWKVEKGAFVTLITGDYWKQGIVLVQSAREHNVQLPFIVMVVDADGLAPFHPNFTKLPTEVEDNFARLDAEVRYIDPVPVPQHAAFDNPRWAIAWNKLRAFQFTEYDKLVFLDSDMMVMRDITEMLTFPDFSAAPGHDVPCETHHGVSGGAFVFAPNETVYNELMQFAETEPGDHWRQAEQELLAYFYPAYYKHRLHLMSGLYNISMRSCQCLTPVVFNDHVKVLHFYSGEKPWRYTQDEWAEMKNQSGKLEHACLADVSIRWYDVLTRGMQA